MVVTLVFDLWFNVLSLAFVDGVGCSRDSMTPDRAD